MGASGNGVGSRKEFLTTRAQARAKKGAFWLDDKEKQEILKRLRWVDPPRFAQSDGLLR